MRKSNLHKRRKINKIIGSKITIGILVIVVIVLARATWSVYQKERVTSSALSEVNKQQNELAEQKVFLTSEIERLQTKEGIEEEIRDRYGLAKPGENIIILVDDEEKKDTVKSDDSIWKKIKSWFVGE